jgi:hypothetical protein
MLAEAPSWPCSCYKDGMLPRTHARIAILGAFSADRLTLSAAELDAVRIAHGISPHAWNRARAALSVMRWLTLDKPRGQSYGTATWTSHPEKMSGRHTRHLRRQDEGRRSIGREHWSRVIANEIAESIVSGEIDATEIGEVPNASGDVPAEPDHEPQPPQTFGDYGNPYARRFHEYHPELGLIVCRRVMPNSLAKCPQCGEPGYRHARHEYDYGPQGSASSDSSFGVPR